jgi:3-oxoacyl-[acyl-carrier-protein] synthase II
VPSEQPRDEHIYITGLGTISAMGCDTKSVRDAYHTGEPRIRPREYNGKPTPVGALSDAAERELQAFLDENPRYAELDRTVHLALFAARRAAKRAGWRSSDAGGVMIGSSRGATGLLERHHAEFLRNPGGKMNPLASPTTTLGNISNWVAQELGTNGPTGEMSSTCSTSTYAIGTALAWIRGRMSRRFIAGGAEAPLTDFTLAQMRALRIYSRDVESPYPCRPCASDAGRRNTMVLGEGAGIVAVEYLDEDEVERRADRARSERGTPPGTPLARIAGAGFSVEPIETNTGLSEEGDSLRRAMRQALALSRLETVDCIVTHTPGTALGDRAELNAIRRLFGDRQLPVLTSNKWLLGHTLGASGVLAIEYALCILRTQHWAEYPYPVPFTNHERQIRSVMVNSVGFGGNAGSLILVR